MLMRPGLRLQRYNKFARINFWADVFVPRIGERTKVSSTAMNAPPFKDTVFCITYPDMVTRIWLPGYRYPANITRELLLRIFTVGMTHRPTRMAKQAIQLMATRQHTNNAYDAG